MADLGGDPAQINPLIPAELVIDHSVQVDAFASRMAFGRNVELEFERNRERYLFLRWGQNAFDGFKVVPPGTGICHQVNLEYLARVVEDRDGVAFPDTLVGTDSHTTMVNGLGVLGWGVGGIEAEAAMLGQPLSMLVPQVVGFKLSGCAAGRRDRDRPRADRDRDAAQDRRRRQVRRVLRRRRRVAAAGRPRDAREHVARVRRDVRLLPGRPDHARLPAADRPPRRADRARRGVLQGEPALARPDRPRDVLAGRRARPRRRRAVDRRAAPAAGPRAARDGEARVHRHARHVRRRLRERLARPRGRRHVPRLRPDDRAAAGRRAAPRQRPGRDRRATRAPAHAGRRRRLRARPRLRRDRGDHLVHEHVEPAGDGRRRPARAERARARPAAQAVGQVVARAGLEGRHRATTSRPACRSTSTRSASTPSATAARPASATRARSPTRSRRRSPRATSSSARCSPATATSRRASIPR